jgi:hypothetical protein
MILSIRNLLKIWKEWLIFDDNFLVGLEACFFPLSEIQKKSRDEDEYHQRLQAFQKKYSKEHYHDLVRLCKKRGQPFNGSR